jgi:hypothetical protein
MKLTTKIRQNPPDHRGGYDLPIEDLTAEADTYEAAYAELQERTPAGWSMLFVREPADL